MRFKILFVFSALFLAASNVLSENNKTTSDQRFSFDQVKAAAKKLSESPYKAEISKLPPEIKHMNYDTYNLICCNRDLWSDPKINFEITFFPIGGLHQTPVKINEILDDKSAEFKFNKDYFTFNKPADFLKSHMPDDAGFAGFRVITKGGKNPGEKMVFLGASYFRLVSPGASFGLSARGLSISSGIPGICEEFPAFKEFWIEKPKPGSDSITIYALLDSQSLSGAYKFILSVDSTMMTKVNSVIYPRVKTNNVGFAHLTSMFWFNEVKTWLFYDFRPNIHNSDGLIISGDDKQIWEPLVNYPYFPIIISDTPIKKLNYFGLLQRNRNYESFQDHGVKYHLNPSIWITPDGDWGSGKVRLVQMPTLEEWSDNINAMWMPDKPIEPGASFELDYTMHTSLDAPEEKLAKVVKTLLGKQAGEQNYTFSLSFAGGELDSIKSDKDIRVELKMSDKIKEVRYPIVLKIPYNNTINVSFVIQSLEKDPWNKPHKTIECALYNAEGKRISETWRYSFHPYWRGAPAPTN